MPYHFHILGGLGFRFSPLHKSLSIGNFKFISQLFTINHSYTIINISELNVGYNMINYIYLHSITIESQKFQECNGSSNTMVRCSDEYKKFNARITRKFNTSQNVCMLCKFYFMYEHICEDSAKLTCKNSFASSDWNEHLFIKRFHKCLSLYGISFYLL